MTTSPNSRQEGLNPRALGTNPRATATNPRATRPPPSIYAIRITAPHFCAGIVVNKSNDRVSRTAPVLTWTKGKRATDILAYAARKGWKVDILDTAATQ